MKFSRRSVLILPAALGLAATTDIQSRLIGVGPAKAEETFISYGPFKGARDGIWGDGTATILKLDDGSYRLDLSDNFSVRPGPDLEVVLVKTDNVTSAKDIMENDYISISQLEKSDGAQSYKLPTGLDPNEYGSVVIYCEEYTVLFSSASRNPGS